MQRDDGAAVRGLQAVQGHARVQHRRLHAVRDLRPAVGLDLADLARQPDAAALGPGRHPQRRRRDHQARRSRRPLVLRPQPGPRRHLDGDVAGPDERDRHRRLLRREAARLPHDDEPVRRAGLGPHAVHEQGQRPDRPAVLGADGRQVPEHVDGAEREGVRVRHRRRRLHHRHPGQLRARRPGHARAPGREVARLGSRRRPDRDARAARPSRRSPLGRARASPSSSSPSARAASRPRSPRARPARPR